MRYKNVTTTNIGRPTKPDLKAYSLKLPIDLHKRVKIHCITNDKTMSDVVTMLLTSWINLVEKKR